MHSQSKPALAIASALNAPGMTHQPPTAPSARASSSRSSGIDGLRHGREIEAGDAVVRFDLVERRNALPAGVDGSKAASRKPASRGDVDGGRNLAAEHDPARSLAVDRDHGHRRKEGLRIG